MSLLERTRVEDYLPDLPSSEFDYAASRMLLRLCRPDVRRGSASPFAGVIETGLRPSFGLRQKRWARGRTWGIAPIVFPTLRRGRASPHIGAAEPRRMLRLRLCRVACCGCDYAASHGAVATMRVAWCGCRFIIPSEMHCRLIVKTEMIDS